MNLATIDRRTVNKEVLYFRKKFVFEFKDDFIKSYNPDTSNALLTNSLHKENLANFPHKDAEQIFNFTLFITKKMIDYFCENYEDPYKIAFFSSRTLELSGYNFLDPINPDRTLENLSISKKNGYFFTPPEIALYMAERSLADKGNYDLVLDPAAGCGSLLSSVLIQAEINKIHIKKIVGIELDPFTSKILKQVLNQIMSVLNI